MCRKPAEADNRMEEAESAEGLGRSFAPRPLRSLEGRAEAPGDRSAQSQDVSLLPVLHGIGVPTGALVPDVAGHGEGNHLGGTQAANFSQTHRLV